MIFFLTCSPIDTSCTHRHKSIHYQCTFLLLPSITLFDNSILPILLKVLWWSQWNNPNHFWDIRWYLVKVWNQAKNRGPFKSSSKTNRLKDWTNFLHDCSGTGGYYSLLKWYYKDSDGICGDLSFSLWIISKTRICTKNSHLLWTVHPIF